MAQVRMENKGSLKKTKYGMSPSELNFIKTCQSMGVSCVRMRTFDMLLKRKDVLYFVEFKRSFHEFRDKLHLVCFHQPTSWAQLKVIHSFQIPSVLVLETKNGYFVGDLLPILQHILKKRKANYTTNTVTISISEKNLISFNEWLKRD